MNSEDSKRIFSDALVHIFYKDLKDPSIIENLINKCDINATYENGITPLMIAFDIRKKDTDKANKSVSDDIIKLMLRCPDLNINIKSESGLSLLFHAFSDNSEDIIMEILGNPDININITNQYKLSPLVYSILNELSENIIKKIMELMEKK